MLRWPLKPGLQVNLKGSNGEFQALPRVAPPLTVCERELVGLGKWEVTATNLEVTVF